MKKNIILGLVAGLLFTVGSHAEAKIKVTASNTYLADIVQEIGKDKVEVYAVASPKFNAHFYQPTPKDVRKVRRSDLYVSVGLDLEAWSQPLLEAAGKPALFRGGADYVDASKGVHLLHPPEELSRSQGDIHLHGNPHYLMSPDNAVTVAENIAEGLYQKDPVNRSFYKANLQNYLKLLSEKIREWKQLCSHCEGQAVIPYHDDTVYLADFLGLKTEMTVEPKPGIPPTAKHLVEAKKYADQYKVKLITTASYFPKEATERLSQMTGAEVAIIAQNVGEVSGTETVINFYEHNIRNISQGLR